MRIAVNPGHCPGLDSGAVGEQYTEAEIVRDVAQAVCEELEAEGQDALFIQENELNDICSISNDFKADIFVSIHCNAANHNAEGTETFNYYDSNAGYILAKCIQHRLVESMQSVDRGLKEAGFQVIKYTDCPAVLTELDFIDNPEREEYLATHIDEMALAIVEGINDYIEESSEW